MDTKDLVLLVTAFKKQYINSELELNRMLAKHWQSHCMLEKVIFIN